MQLAADVLGDVHPVGANLGNSVHLSGQLGIVPPIPQGRRGAEFLEITAVDQQYPAEIRAVHQLFGLLAGLMEAYIEVDAAHQSFFPGQTSQGIRLGIGEAERLFTQNVFARLQQPAGIS